MITMLKKIVPVILFCVFETSAFTQTDTAHIIFSEEPEEQSDYKLRKNYQYLDIKIKDENYLIKIAPKFQLIKKYGYLSLEVGIEKKVLKEYSVQVYNSSVLSFDPYSSNEFSGNLSIEARYYPGLKKKIDKGTSGNNMNGVYIGLGSSTLFEYSTGKLINNEHTDYNIQRPFPYFVIGVQKRLNNWSFLEVYSIAGYTKDAYYYPMFEIKRLYSTLGFRLGLAWGNNK